MSSALRRVDSRFLLPRTPHTAAVIGSLGGWRAGLAELDWRPPENGPPDLVVAPAENAGEAVATGAEMLVVEGRSAKGTLERAGFRARRFLPLPDIAEPEILLPLDQPRPARYAVTRLTLARRRWRQARNLAVAALLERGLLPTRRPLITVGVRGADQPAAVATAQSFGVPPGSDWLLTLGRPGFPRNRPSFQIFPPGEREPSWVLKFARGPGFRHRFDDDERGLRMAEAEGGRLAAHVPRLLNRFDLDGLPASLEMAAVGSHLTGLLEIRRGRAGKVGLVGEIGRWLIDVGAQTARDAGLLAAERERLESDVLPAWEPFGVRPGLARELPPVPSVLAHGDPGTWNFLVRPPEFFALDWEGARRHAFPLWDLTFFLADACAQLDGAPNGPERTEHFRRLWRGELALSALVHDLMRRAADACGVPAGTVGAIVTLCWLDYGLADMRRTEGATRGPGVDVHPSMSMMGALALAWLTDPGLGTSWEPLTG